MKVGAHRASAGRESSGEGRIAEGAVSVEVVVGRSEISVRIDRSDERIVVRNITTAWDKRKIKPDLDLATGVCCDLGIRDVTARRVQAPSAVVGLASAGVRHALGTDTPFAVECAGRAAGMPALRTLG